jgi:hypothetical protein
MKIALVRIKRQYFDETEEWVRDHMTDFSEVSPSEYNALRSFVDSYNSKHRSDRQYIIVEDESHLLPKTIAEALDYAEKEKRRYEQQEKLAIQKQKEQEKLRKQKKMEKLAFQVLQLEKYKSQLAKSKSGIKLLNSLKEKKKE